MTPICAAGAIALLTAPFASPVAARKPISGTLTKSGYSVIALARNGRASSVGTKGGKFKLTPPSDRVTLHLRAQDGTYAGPITVAVAKRGKRAIMGVRAGVHLGRIAVKGGYGKVVAAPPAKWLDNARWARAKRGVPLGAQNFGLVTSKNAQGGAPGDTDLDGVPDALDVDDNGNRVLDDLDHTGSTSAGRSIQEGGCGPNNAYCQPVAFSLALTELEQTVNINAGSTVEQINAQLVAHGALRFPLNLLNGSVELDCGGQPDPQNPNGWVGGLPYCTRGGTGVASAGGPGPAFPACCDADGDGFGSLDSTSGGPDSFVAPRATLEQIKTGDILNLRITQDGTETQAPATVNFVFLTVPALVSYADAAGNSGTISYPIGPDDPGTVEHGFPVAGGACPSGAPAACVDGDVVLTLTFWRPQRRPIAGADPPGAEWMDIGHLTYVSYAPEAGHPANAGGCPQDTFASADPNLTTPTLPILGTGGLEDVGGDQVSNAGNTLTYKLDVTKCMAANGLTFNTGEERRINFMAVSGATDIAEQQGFAFKRQ